MIDGGILGIEPGSSSAFFSPEKIKLVEIKLPHSSRSNYNGFLKRSTRDQSISTLVQKVKRFNL